MEKEFVPYEIALELKELGFDEECMGLYEEVDNNIKLLYTDPVVTLYLLNKAEHEGRTYHCKAPLWQQAFDWFRSKGLYSSLDKLGDGFCVYAYKDLDGRDETLFDLLDEEKRKLHVFNTYEKARIKCIENLIKLIKE